MAEYDPDFDYLGNVQRLGLVMNALATVDLDGIVTTTEYADTLGPFIDPTKYRDALYRGDMHAMRDLAAALREPVRIWNEKIAPKLAPAVTS